MITDLNDILNGTDEGEVGHRVSGGPSPFAGVVHARASKNGGRASKPVVTVGRSMEFRRVEALPRRVLNYDGIQDVTDLFRQSDGAMSLRPIQSAALLEAAMMNGGFFPLSCGAGKTLITLLLPIALDSENAVLIVPPQLKKQITREIETLYGKHFEISAALRIIAYSEISTAKTADMLEDIGPDLLIADECFPSDTIVETSEGPLTIGEIVNARLAPQILSASSRGLEYKQLRRRIKRFRKTPLVRVLHDQGSLVCTENHKIWTERGYVEARNLRSDDRLRLVREGSARAVPRQGNVRVLLDEVRGQDSMAPGKTRSGEASERRKSGREASLRSLSKTLSAFSSGSEILRQEVRERFSFGTLPGQGDIRGLDQVRRVQSDEVRQEEGQRHREVLLSELLHPPHDGRPRGETENQEGVVGLGEYAGREGSLRKSTNLSIEDVQDVQGGFSFSFARESQLVEDHLFGEMRSAVRHVNGTGGEERNEGSGFLSSYEAQQPDEQPDHCRKDARQVDRSDVHLSRREWQAHRAATLVGRSAQLAYGVGDPYGPVEGTVSFLADGLQGRRGGSFGASSNRSGRQQSQVEEMEVPRSTQGGGTSVSRVVRVEVLESRGDGQQGDGAGDDFVYDLEVEDNHNYFADGVLVSNCHLLKNRTSARTKRVSRFLKENPSCRFVALSGTITSRSLNDYSHLIEYALRKSSPLPRGYREVQDWAGALDVKPEYECAPGALLRFCEGSESPREGFRRRLIESQGVVASSENEVGASLVVTRGTIKIPAAVQKVYDEAKKSWSIGGEEFSDILTRTRKLREIACGFYYRWAWPGGEPDYEWLEARANWNKAVREKLKQSRAGLDSPLLLANAAARSARIARAEALTGPDKVEAFAKLDEVSGALWPQGAEVWAAWKAINHRKAPPTEAIWLDDFLLLDLQKRATNSEGATIIWYEHQAVGERLAALTKWPLYGEGTDASASKEPIIIASIVTQGTGKNLQHFSNNLFASLPPNGTKFEQTIARTHRPGQLADTVTAFWYAHTDECADAMAKIQADALYQQDTTGAPQKVLRCTHVIED